MKRFVGQMICFSFSFNHLVGSCTQLLDFIVELKSICNKVLIYFQMSIDLKDAVRTESL